MKRSLKRMANTAFATVGIAVLATAATGCEVNGCADDRLCLFEGGGYTSHEYRFSVGTNDAHYADNHWYGQGDNGVDNDTSSLVNNTKRWVTVFRDADYHSSSLCVAPGKSVRDMAAHVISMFPNTTMDNKASSHLWGSTTGPVDGKSSCRFVVE